MIAESHIDFVHGQEAKLNICAKVVALLKLFPYKLLQTLSNSIETWSTAETQGETGNQAMGEEEEKWEEGMR